MFSIDQLGHVLPDFIKNSMRDRHKYDTVYSCIESYICEFAQTTDKSFHGDKKIIVSGNLGILLLLNAPKGIDDFTYTLYTESSFLHANNLSNKIAETVKDKWIVCMRTIVQNNDFEITVDGRRIVNFIRLINVPDGTTAANIIRPVSAQLNNRLCIIMNPMFYLIDLYRTLYSPEKFKEWQLALCHEKVLFEYLKRGFTRSRRQKSKWRHYMGSEQTSDIKPITTSDISMFIIRKYIVDNPNIILIGDAAQRLIIKSSIITSIITVISNNSAETDIANISKLLADNYGSKYPVSHTHGNVKVIGDFRLSRTTVKVGSEHDKQDLMYIYNSANYELIPFNKIGTDNFIQIGNPFVILRFHLIDIWIVRWLVAASKLNDHFAESKIRKIMKNVIELRSYMSTDTRQLMGTTDAHTIKYEIDISCITGGQSHTIFQSHIDQYMGIIHNEITAYKLHVQQKASSAKARGIYSSMYHPQKYYLEYNQYRNIESNEKNNN